MSPADPYPLAVASQTGRGLRHYYYLNYHYGTIIKVDKYQHLAQHLKRELYG